MGEPDDVPPFGFDPSIFESVPLFAELAKLLRAGTGPVNYEVARQSASSVIKRTPPAIGAESDEAALADAVRVAELWLDEVMSLPAVTGPVRTLDADAWAEQALTADGLGAYVEPVASGMREALGRNLSALGLPGLEQLGGMAQVLNPIGALFAGLQLGTIAGHLAGQLLTTYDLGLPTVDPRTIGTVGSAAAEMARDYEFDPVEFRFWLALHEAAHRRLFVGVPWLRRHVREEMGAFARATDFDAEGMAERFGGLSPDALSDPEALTRAIEEAGNGIGEPSAEQQAVLARLQTLISLVQGYTGRAVERAAVNRLTGLPRIMETVTRRRARKGPGEQFLASLIGLDLQPADLRAGRAFCDAVVAARGESGLAKIWTAPELLPSPTELTDPSRWLLRLAASGDDVDDLLPQADVDVPDDLSELE